MDYDEYLSLYAGFSAKKNTIVYIQKTGKK